MSQAQVNLRARRCRRGGGEGCSSQAGGKGAQCTCVPDRDGMKGGIHMSLWAFVFCLKELVSLNLRNVQLYPKLFMTIDYLCTKKDWLICCWAFKVLKYWIFGFVYFTSTHCHVTLQTKRHQRYGKYCHNIFSVYYCRNYSISTETSVSICV